MVKGRDVICRSPVPTDMQRFDFELNAHAQIR